MTTDEWQQFKNSLIGWWPDGPAGGWTDELVELWRDAVRHLPFQSAQNTLRDYALTPRKPFEERKPRVDQFIHLYQKRQQQHQEETDSAPQKPGMAETIRAKWSKQWPKHASRINAMGDHEVCLLHAKLVAERSAELRGANGGAKRAFDEWQRLAEEMGYERITYAAWLDSIGIEHGETDGSREAAAAGQETPLAEQFPEAFDESKFGPPPPSRAGQPPQQTKEQP